MNIAKYEKYLLALPIALVIVSLVSLGVWGLKPGIDLAGGSLLQVTYPEGRPAVEAVRETASSLGFGEVRVQPTGESSYLLRQRTLTPDEKNALEQALASLGTMREDQYTSIGPTIGSELRQKAWIAIALIVLCIILFIAFAFRKVSEPVASWKYGVVAILTLIHDILIPMGLFAYLGFARGAEVDALFIVGLLTILGISINDTIVVFDRLRENLRRNEEGHKHEAFEDTVWKSIKQTMARSINTSLTVIIVLVALYALGPAATKNFALTLIVGMIAGTYSSIFLASPLLVIWNNWSQRAVRKAK